MYGINEIIKSLEEIINETSHNLKLISEEEFNKKEFQHKWSKKEVLGHLIDSAHNNIQRFIRGQYEKNPKIVYDQDLWVSLNNYQNSLNWELVDLWKLLNRQIIQILKSINTNNLKSTCDIGNNIQDIKSIQWLVEDYVEHLKHHLKQLM
jgi:hypothetical protein